MAKRITVDADATRIDTESDTLSAREISGCPAAEPQLLDPAHTPANVSGASPARTMVRFTPESVQDFTVQTSAFSVKYVTPGVGFSQRRTQQLAALHPGRRQTLLLTCQNNNRSSTCSARGVTKCVPLKVERKL